VPTAT